ncbi:hypothetical protein DY000_02034779 [Brassica cretica]|uniref:Uncharacterized protein n=1 Tax=Brassica cretica TaxID=69181 RepID=A0ABQ7DCX4_BRACR|nr:hypothetical protein DY000_02034779 [Brassica cretica]
MRLPIRSASCFNRSNPEEAREKLEREFSRTLTEVAERHGSIYFRAAAERLDLTQNKQKPQHVVYNYKWCVLDKVFLVITV